MDQLYITNALLLMLILIVIKPTAYIKNLWKRFKTFMYFTGKYIKVKILLKKLW